MHELLRRIKMLFSSRRWRRELDEEMRLHRDLRGDDRRFGNELRLRERSRAQWGWTWLETWAQDARHGLRLLRRTPLITALALVSLALGIGATTALFSLADAVMFRPLPVTHPEQLVELSALRSGQSWPYFNNLMYQAIQRQPGLFAASFAASRWSFALDREGHRRMADGIWASGSYFPDLGIRAERGRLFGPQDDYPGCPPIADISDAFWHSHFGGSANAVGSALTLSGHGYTVIGVTSPSFFGTGVGQGFDVALPLCTEAIQRGNESLLDKSNASFLRIFGRLRPGESLAAAQAQLTAEHVALTEALPADERSTFHPRLLSAAQGWSLLRNREGTPLLALLAVAGLVWLLACANLAALMLARTAARQPETAVRMALGASRARLARQWLTESLLLALGGAVLGVPLTAWGTAAAVRFWSNPGYPLRLNTTADWRVTGFAVGLTLATAVLVGLAPGLRSRRWQLATRARSVPGTALGRRLMAVQLAVALVLLACAGLFARSLARLTGPNKGFNASQVLTARFLYGIQPAQRDALLRRLGALPGITAVGASAILPAQGSSWDGSVWRPDGSLKLTRVAVNGLLPGYFAALQTPLIAGRGFTAGDAQHPVAILNEALATRLFPSAPAVGQAIRSSTNNLNPRASLTIVGVVANAKYESLRAPAPPTLYVPMPDTDTGTTFELRTALGMSATEREVRGTLTGAEAADATLRPFGVLLNSRIKPERLLAVLAGLFGGLALLLAAIGLFGVTSYNAGRRRKEFGIRAALGAGGSAIAAQVWREAGPTVMLALALGGALAWLVTSAARTQFGDLLYDISPRDAGTWALAAAALCAAAAIAAYLPARRAARADPMTALRED